jgi:hypothetical protein
MHAGVALIKLLLLLAGATLTGQAEPVGLTD